MTTVQPSHSTSYLAVEKNHAQFCELLEQALAYARTLGASDAVAEVSESKGLSVSVRNLDIETVEQTSDRGLNVTVFDGQRRGSASTSDFSVQALRSAVDAAWHIARHTAADDCAGLPDAGMLALNLDATPDTPAQADLQLHRPWVISAEQAARIAVQAERAACVVSPLISNTEGASVSAFEGQFVLANTRGFMAGFPYSRHSVSVAPIAGQGDHMQRDYWYTSSRDPNQLASPAAVGRYAAQRTLSRLHARPVKTGRFPVLFEAPLAVGLLGALVQATSGGALYRKASFLLDSLGKPVMADHLDVLEDPFVPGGMGSGLFDDEGVRTQRRQIVQGGVLQGYFLSTYTGRKLGMPSTGNAGGSHNLALHSRATRPKDNFKAMLKKMGTGLLVTELIGQGVNYLTGDYSRGAFGYWVQNGEIQHPVQEITIAGNLQDMLRQIVAVGSDTITRGAKTSGSVLVEQMSVAGQ